MGAIGIGAFISRTGDAMQDSAKLKVLFIAGFGPIVRDTGESRRLYRDVLGMPFKEEADGYLHSEAVPGAKSFALWPLSQAAQSCFGKDSWPKDIPAPQAWLEFDVESVEKATVVLESGGYRMLVKNKKEPWGQIVSRFISPEKLLVGITFTPSMREPK
jgi:catechol 2,3-dioxygenase-like lactoylglutathione lyase family enzyme